MAIPLAVSAIEAEPQAKVQSKVLGHAPVVLEIGFYDPVPVVVLGLKIDLGELGNFAR